MSAIAKLSLAEYERIVACGVFDWPNNRRIELIRGVMRELPRKSPDECDAVDRLCAWSFRQLSVDAFRIRVRNPLAFASIDSEPEPDIAWVKKKNYAHAHPTPADVLLVIEVADSRLVGDRREKAALYAEVGIPEYWIFNLLEGAIEVYRDPQPCGYRIVQALAAEGAAQPLAAQEAALSGAHLLAAPG